MIRRFLNHKSAREPDRPDLGRISATRFARGVSAVKHAQRNLVARVVHSAGYNLLSFTRAFAVLNCQSALVCFLLRSASHASTSCFNTR
jgi:hypothetical protein